MSASWSDASVGSSAPFSAVTPRSTRAGNSRPMTAASRTTHFSSSVRRSIRAATTPRTVTGIGSSRDPLSCHVRSPPCTAPVSRRLLVSSSTKNGLPSVRATTKSRRSSETFLFANSETSSALVSDGVELRQCHHVSAREDHGTLRTARQDGEHREVGRREELIQQRRATRRRPSAGPPRSAPRVRSPQDGRAGSESRGAAGPDTSPGRRATDSSTIP